MYQLERTLDLATTAPEDAPHEVQPPPSEDETTQHIVEILLAGGTIYLMAQAIGELLAPLGITASAIVSALNFTTGRKGSPFKVRPRYIAEGVHPKSAEAGVIRTVANEEMYYRAAYILNAAYRIQKKLNQGEPIRAVLTEENFNYRLHKSAQANRIKAATNVARAASLFGPLLGWYLNPLLNNESECIAADGNNFHFDKVPVIGLPGSVHSNCGCKAGPPHEGAGMVDDAVRHLVVRTNRPKLLRLRKAS